MKYANGKEPKPGQQIVAIDEGNNLVFGNVSSLHQNGVHVRINTTPILVKASHAMLLEDIAGTLQDQIKANEPKTEQPQARTE